MKKINLMDNKLARYMATNPVMWEAVGYVAFAVLILLVYVFGGN